jgi:hypothetical protein
MLKKLRRYSSGYIPVKKRAKLLIKAIEFEKPASPICDPYKVAFASDNRITATTAQKIHRGENVVSFEESLSLSITFYQDGKGKIMEKKGTISVQAFTQARYLIYTCSILLMS